MSSWYIKSSIYMINLISKHQWHFKFTLHPLFKISCDITRLLKITFLTVKVKKLGGNWSLSSYFLIYCVFGPSGLSCLLKICLKPILITLYHHLQIFQKKAYYLFLHRLKSTYLYENLVLLWLPQAISIYILRYW